MIGLIDARYIKMGIFAREEFGCFKSCIDPLMEAACFLKIFVKSKKRA